MNVDLDLVQEIIADAVEGHIHILDSWLEERRERYARLVGHGNPYYSAFYAIAEELKPSFSVELGSYQANASAHLAAGNPKGMVITIDIHREDKDAQRMAQEAAARYGNLEYVNGWTWDNHVVFQVGSVAADTPIDLLYIDAWHEYQYAMHEWEIYSKMLSSEALVICDDIFDLEGATTDMVRFWREVSDGYESFLDRACHSNVPMGFFRYLR